VTTPPIIGVDRSRLPDSRSVPRFTFPAVEKSVLENGLRVWSVRHDGVPLIGFLLIVKRGAADDPPGKEGLAAITADMLDEGTGVWSAIEVHQEIAASARSSTSTSALTRRWSA
jgi:zinc protease